MRLKQVQLRRLFSSSIGGSWGDPPEDGPLVLPCVRGTDLDFRRLRVKPNSAPLRSYTSRDIAYRAASRGDIIIEKSGGGDKQPVGRVALWDQSEPVMPTNFAGRLRPSPGHEPRFLAYLLAALYYEGRTVAAIKQTTGIQNLDLQAFLSTRVPLLELPTQRAIADYLDTENSRIDTLVTKTRQAVNLLTERRQTLITATVTGKSAVPADRDLRRDVGATRRDGRMTDCLRLRHISKVVTSNVDKLKSDNETPIRLVNYTDVYYGDRLTPDLPLMWATASASEIAKHRVAAGDVLITKDSETADDIGVAAYVETTSEDLVCGYHLSRIRANRSRVDPRYLFWALTGRHARDQMSVAATGVTRFGLRADSIRDLVIRVPSLAEQRVIADYLDAETNRIDTLITKKHRMIELLNERRHALMTVTVAHELHVPASIEPS